MKLKSFGCSFIFGSELADDGSGEDYARFSRLTWPALLAKDLGYTYYCYARPGSGNLRIMERVLSHTTHDQESLYVIGWTWMDRFDYITDPDPFNPCEPIPWKTIMPVDGDKLADTYYKHLHTETRDKLSTLMCIKLAIDTLKQKGCQFIMTSMEDWIFSDHVHPMPAITDLQRYVKPYLNRFEGDSFLNWSRKKGYPVSDMWHPLEPAHQAASELVVHDLNSWIRK